MKYDKNNPLKGFTFHPNGYGAYTVVYQSEHDFNVGRYYKARITDMTIIDAVKNSQHPKKCDVDTLRRMVKNGECKRIL